MERQVLADQQKAAVILAGGGKADEHFPKLWAVPFEGRLVEFDEALAAAPKHQPKGSNLMRELGLVA